MAPNLKLAELRSFYFLDDVCSAEVCEPVMTANELGQPAQCPSIYMSGTRV